jgi:hypothetical protein
MTPSFQRLMVEATRLTRAGDLQRATAAIQAALGGMRFTEDEAGVIDVEAREVEDAAAIPSPARPQAGEFVAGRHAAGTREYKLYVPPGYRGQALPLVVMLHGCTQDPDDFAAGTRMNQAALERDFFVLYPAQARKANARRCWNWFKTEHQRLAGHRLLQRVGMSRELVADRGANEVAAVGIEAFLHQQIDLPEVDVAEVEGDLLVDRSRGGRQRASGWHAAILTPSTWMMQLALRRCGNIWP